MTAARTPTLAGDAALVARLPTSRDEAWRYVPVGDLLERLERATPPRSTYALASAQIDVMAGDHGGPRLVFLDGALDAASSTPAAPGGVHLAVGPRPARGGTHRPPEAGLDGFVDLNRSSGTGVAEVEVAAGEAVDAPIHIVHVVAPELDSCTGTHPGTVVRVGRGASAVVIETYVGFSGQAFTNAVTEIEVEDGASLSYHRVQTEPAEACHVGHVALRVGSGGRVRATSWSVGGRISRVAFDARLDRGSELDLRALQVPGARDHHDLHVAVEHAGSHTRSDQRYRGVVGDHGRGSFTGKVVVPAGVVDIRADQAAHSVLLAPTAEADARPWLEIGADDVRCTHGATVGRLDDDALHYLRTRGIPVPEARRLLVEGFVRCVADAVEVASLRDHLLARIGAEQRRVGSPR